MIDVTSLFGVSAGNFQPLIGKAIGLDDNGNIVDIADNISGLGNTAGLSPGLVSVPSSSGGSSTGDYNGTSSFNGANNSYNNFNDINGTTSGGTVLGTYDATVAYLASVSREINLMIFGWTGTYQDQQLSAANSNLPSIYQNLNKRVVGIVNSGPGYTTVKYSDGSVETRKQTTINNIKYFNRGVRNNNPGNLKAYNFTQSQPGYIGQDYGGMGIFATRQDGINAYVALLSGSSYRNLTIAQAISRYAPPNENNTSDYIATVVRAVGVSPNTIVGTLTPSQRQAMALAQIKKEEGSGSPLLGSATVNIADAHFYIMEDATLIAGLNKETESTFSGEKYKQNSLTVAVVGGKVGSVKTGGSETSHKTITENQKSTCSMLIKAYEHVYPHGQVFGADELGMGSVVNPTTPGLTPVESSVATASV